MLILYVVCIIIIGTLTQKTRNRKAEGNVISILQLLYYKLYYKYITQFHIIIVYYSV